jgi:hypothetical protein
MPSMLKNKIMDPQLPQSRRAATAHRTMLALTLGLVSLAQMPNAEAQTLQLRYTFEDTGTTAASDPAGALNVPLTLLNAAGAATDVHGGAN